MGDQSLTQPGFGWYSVVRGPYNWRFLQIFSLLCCRFELLASPHLSFLCFFWGINWKFWCFGMILFFFFFFWELRNDSLYICKLIAKLIDYSYHHVLSLKKKWKISSSLESMHFFLYVIRFFFFFFLGYLG